MNRAIAATPRDRPLVVVDLAGLTPQDAFMRKYDVDVDWLTGRVSILE